MKELDITELSPFARFMITNKGYYFEDKKMKIIVDKWEIFNTFKKEELESIYNGTQSRYIRKKRNEVNYEI